MLLAADCWGRGGGDGGLEAGGMIGNVVGEGELREGEGLVSTGEAWDCWDRMLFYKSWLGEGCQWFWDGRRMGYGVNYALQPCWLKTEPT